MSFVLMSNHFHLLIRTPKANLDKAMNYFMREVSRAINRASGRINHVFGGPYAPSLITETEYLNAAYRYIYRNPVDAGLVDRAEDYRFSTLHGLLGKSHLFIPLCEDVGLISNTAEQLAWLNKDYEQEERENVRKALRRREFKYPRSKTGMKRQQQA